MSMFKEDKSGLSKSAKRSLRQSLKTPVIMALIVTLVFVGGGGTWAYLVPIASASLASGTVSPEGHRKTIQHLEGGIVRDILVREGQQVKEGQELLVLEDTQALISFRAQTHRLLALAAIETRLSAEEKGLFDPEWSHVPEGENRAEVIQDQKRIFETRNDNMLSQQDILNQRILQLREEIGGLEAEIKGTSQAIRLMDQQIKMMDDLTDRGLARKTQLLELQRQRAEALGRLGGRKAAKARAQQTISETELQMLDLETKRRTEAATQLGDIRAQISDLEERLAGAKDILSRTVIKAPASGTIIDMSVKTVGGVVRPGDNLMDIVPDGDRLLIDARVSLTDIDIVHPGLEANVTLSAFSQRTMPKLSGTVLSVSADRKIDEASGEMFFLARVEITPETLAQLDEGMELVPGMPADVMIFTGSRTLVEYLTGPLLVSIDKSFREH